MRKYLKLLKEFIDLVRAYLALRKDKPEEKGPQPKTDQYDYTDNANVFDVKGKRK